jgi:hypothetical protein
MIKIGSDIHVESSEYKGKVYAVIRRYYETDSGELRPGKQGINMKAEEWLEFCEKFEEIKNEINSKILVEDE